MRKGERKEEGKGKEERKERTVEKGTKEKGKTQNNTT